MAARRLGQRSLGQLRLQFHHVCLVLEKLPLSFVLDLLELATELVLFIQGLGQLGVQGFRMIGGGGGTLDQFLPGGSKPKILGLKRLDHVSVGFGPLRTLSFMGSTGLGRGRDLVQHPLESVDLRLINLPLCLPVAAILVGLHS